MNSIIEAQQEFFTEEQNSVCFMAPGNKWEHRNTDMARYLWDEKLKNDNYPIKLINVCKNLHSKQIPYQIIKLHQPTWDQKKTIIA